LDSLCEQSVQLCGPDIDSKDDFETFVKQHMKGAYLTALGLVGNREDALELSQEAFFRAYKHYDQLNAKGKFFPWFYQILRNLCFSHLRKRRVRRAHELRMDDGGLRMDDSGPNPPSDLPNPQSENVADGFDPEMVAQRNESKDRVWQAIGQLDEKHREVIVLRHFRNLSYDEMAKLLFCNRGTVTSRLFYARQKLKEILEHESGSPHGARVEGVPPSNRGQDARDTSVWGPRKGGQTL
jgi:RNA polymerase sigma-70 factor (ECF subfamily)